MMYKFTKTYLLNILLVLGFISCKPKDNMIYMTNNNFHQEISDARYVGLRLQEGDILEIIVSAYDDIAVKPFNLSTMEQTNASIASVTASTPKTNQYPITAEGYITMPVLGSVYCKGMTQQQLKQDLEVRLRQYLIDPLVNVRLTNFNISVLGEVKNPGQKTSATERLNLFQALALAGDMTDGGNRTNVKLVRYSELLGKDEVIAINLSEADIVNSPYYYLQQNDILYVEPDRNKQIAANTNPNKALYFQIFTVLLATIGLIIRFK